ncbi:GNAT family N-acetyltransferase [Cognatishimia sp. MH4019]|uniref:GNAT family N-acetyltransferase n=1 Tax=Cognatishimia sp. MH4019 TaxID=2854030 RepID=UPI001CD6A54D|nr:GNAT family N-acetyltransferase [Cognatishimia sp. MH4019]
MTAADLAATHALSFTTPRPWSAVEFTDLLASPHIHLLGDPTAFLMVRTVLDETEILTLATHPDHRRKGHAQRLLDQLHENQTGRIFLEVAADNQPAKALYTHAGYRAEAHRKDYYRTPDGTKIDALIMVRDPVSD